MPLLLALLPFAAGAQLRTGNSGIVYIGAGTSVTVMGRATLTSDITGTGNLVLGATTTLQDIDAGGLKIPNLVINSAANVSMLSNAVVTNTLTLTQGKVFTNNNFLTLQAPATAQGYSSTSYVITGDSAGNTATAGGLQLTVPAGANVLAPVGANTTNYNPATIKNSTGPAEQYTIRVSPVHVTGPAAAQTLNTSWAITEATAGGNTIALTLQWNGASEPVGFTRTAARIVRTNGVSDVEKTGIIAATGSNPYTITGGAFTGASFFGVTSDVNALMPPIITMHANEALAVTESIAMYPTIVSGNTAQLAVTVPAEKKYLYVIMDASGRALVKKDLPLWKGYNLVPVTLPALASGMYILNVYDGAVLKKSIKFVKG